MAATRIRAVPADGAAAAGRADRSPWLEVGPNGEGLHVFDFPTYMIGRLSGLVRRSLIPGYVEPHGLSIPEWRLLAFLVLSEPSSFNEICANLTMDRAHVSRTLPVLQKRGLIRRIVTLRKGPLRRGETGKQTRFAATAKGRTVYRQALPLAQRHQMALLSVLDRKERAAFYSILQKITSAAMQFEQECAAAALARQAAPRAAQKPARTNGRKSGIAARQKEESLAGGPT